MHQHGASLQCCAKHSDRGRAEVERDFNRVGVHEATSPILSGQRHVVVGAG